MAEGFSGEPLTRWDGYRNMKLEEDFHYIDGNGRKWEAPVGSSLNGATIPRVLWSTIGSPYAGRYRRASVVHDVAVGELDNPDVSDAQRKQADRMFYSACRFDGCSKRFAAILYIGVRFGSWAAGFSLPFKSSLVFDGREEVRESPEDAYMQRKFWKIVDRAGEAIEREDLDSVDEIVREELEDR